MKLTKRRLWLFGAIATAIIIIITLIAAPGTSTNNIGSTYSLAPNGYGAWYAFMQERGTPVQRWQKPFSQLPKQQGKATFIRIHSALVPGRLSSEERSWVEAGNTLVILGVSQPVTSASFSSEHETDSGIVTIKTTRRNTRKNRAILEDDSGLIVWEENRDQGKVIYGLSPFIAANAYQENPGNYEFLAQLVSENSQSLWVDEYLHGYRDKEVIQQEERGNVISYLMQTPIFLVFVQALVILAIAIVANNRRFGQLINLAKPVVDNSQAYIKALAGVLQKAGHTHFVWYTITKEEQLQLQNKMGLGNVLLEPEDLAEKWHQQTGKPEQDLVSLLRLPNPSKRLSESELLNYLSRWQQIQATIGNG